MRTFNLSDPITGHKADIKVPASATAVEALFVAANNTTWARGYNCAGFQWPFAPHVLVDGKLACDVAAEELGGNWVDGAKLYAAEHPAKVADEQPMDDFTAVGIAEGFIEPEDEDQVIAAWQYLHDTGLAYRLQGWFGRQAQHFIEVGIING